MKKLFIFIILMSSVFAHAQVSSYTQQKAYIDANIKPNGTNAITGAMMNAALTSYLLANQPSLEYDVTRPYFVGQFCIYNLSAFLCKENTDNPAGAFDISKWDTISGGGGGTIADSTWEAIRVNNYAYLRDLRTNNGTFEVIDSASFNSIITTNGSGDLIIRDKLTNNPTFELTASGLKLHSITYDNNQDSVLVYNPATNDIKLRYLPTWDSSWTAIYVDSIKSYQKNDVVINSSLTVDSICQFKDDIKLTNTLKGIEFATSSNNRIAETAGTTLRYDGASAQQWGIAGSAKMNLNASSLYPNVDMELDLGISTRYWDDLLVDDIKGYGESAFGIIHQRETSGAGQSTTAQAGGAQSGGTNLNGGNIIVSSGTSTGTGTSSIEFKTATASVSGTADNTPSLKMSIDGSGNARFFDGSNEIHQLSSDGSYKSLTGSFYIKNRANDRYALQINGSGYFQLKNTTNDAETFSLYNTGSLYVSASATSYITLDADGAGNLFVGSGVNNRKSIYLTSSGTFWFTDIVTGAGNIETMSYDGSSIFRLKEKTSGDNMLTINGDGDIITYGTLTETPSATNNISAANGVTTAMLTNKIIIIQGNGGAVDITANPQIAAGTIGDIIELWGNDNTNTVTFDDGDGLQLDGGVSFTMGAGDMLKLRYMTLGGVTDWFEITRSNN